MLKKLNPKRSLKAIPQRASLAALLRDLSERDHLIERIRPLLREDLRCRCAGAGIDGTTLLLFADSPVWAAKLRLFAPELVRALAGQGLALKTCEVRVSPPLMRAPADGGTRRVRISESAAAHLEMAAANIADPRLAACFRRIAAHGRGTQPRLGRVINQPTGTGST